MSFEDAWKNLTSRAIVSFDRFESNGLFSSADRLPCRDPS